jgi:hypothetical protein
MTSQRQFTPVRNDNFTEGVNQLLDAFKIPDNAFTELFNCYAWRNRIVQRLEKLKLGRLERVVEALSLPVTLNTDTYGPEDILGIFRTEEPNAELRPGSVLITIDGNSFFADDGLGQLIHTGGPIDGVGSIDYITGEISLTFTAVVAAGLSVEADYNYFPTLPVMGIVKREMPEINAEETIFFDQRYAYFFDFGVDQFREYQPAGGTTWSGTDYQFFYGTNYFRNVTGDSILWVSNFSGPTGDPIRYTDGTPWTNFLPEINIASDRLHQAKFLVPFRGLLLALNTYEGQTLATSVHFPNRVRASQIGSPLEADAWRDDIPGKGVAFDLPTNEQITGFGYVLDSLIVYTERKKWTLQWTGNSIVPVFEERKNNELGVESYFSIVPFDDSLVGIGDKFIVRSNTGQSVVVNDTLPDFAFQIHNDNEGRRRVAGIRDFKRRLVYWIYPNADEDGTYPNRLLIWNYEENTWAFARENLTALGEFQSNEDVRWQDVTWTWAEWTSTWASASNQSQYPDIAAGNVQGYVFLLNRQFYEDFSATIQGIGIVNGQVVLESPNHNLEDREFIFVDGIIGDYMDLNGRVYRVSPVDDHNFALSELSNGNFVGVTHDPGDYFGGGEFRLLKRPVVRSKKFNFIDQGKKIVLQYMDLLMRTSAISEYTLNVYVDYLEQPLERPPFWSRTIAPVNQPQATPDSTKSFNRFYVGTLGDMVQYEITRTDEQMASSQFATPLEINSLVLYVRPTGILTQ